MPRPSSRCNSCRQLRIACDKARPSCEYCVATNRVCEYQEPKKGVSKKGSKTPSKSPELTPEEKTPIEIGFEEELEEIVPEAIGYNEMWPTEQYLRNGLVRDFSELDLLSQDFHELVTYQPSNLYQNVLGSYQLSSDSLITDLYLNHSETPTNYYMQEIIKRDARGWLMDQDVFGKFIYSQMPLNSVSKQLGISRLEHRLIRDFNLMVFKEAANQYTSMEELDPSTRLWIFEMPQLWRASPAIRQTINCVAAMILTQLQLMDEELLEEENYEVSDHEQFDVFQSDNPLTLINSDLLTKSSPKRKTIDLNTPGAERKILHYFGAALSYTNQMIVSLNENTFDLNPFSAMELVLSSSLLTFFLGLNPFKAVLLISFDGEPDYLSFVSSVSPIIDRTYPILKDSKYSAAHYNNEKVIPDPLITDKYSLVEELRKQLLLFEAMEFDINTNTDSFGANSGDYKAFSQAIRWFERCIYRAIERKNPSLLTRYLFYLEPRVIQLMYQKHYFCLKILYYLSWFMITIELEFETKTNMWTHYLFWFEKYSRGSIHWYPFDQSLYNLVLKDTSIARTDTFKNFDPDTFVSDQVKSVV